MPPAVPCLALLRNLSASPSAATWLHLRFRQLLRLLASSLLTHFRATRCNMNTKDRVVQQGAQRAACSMRHAVRSTTTDVCMLKYRIWTTPHAPLEASSGTLWSDGWTAGGVACGRNGVAAALGGTRAQRRLSAASLSAVVRRCHHWLFPDKTLLACTYCLLPPCSPRLVSPPSTSRCPTHLLSLIFFMRRVKNFHVQLVDHICGGGSVWMCVCSCHGSLSFRCCRRHVPRPPEDSAINHLIVTAKSLPY